jgi:membrane-associated phospholipid phosphatase
MLAPFAQCARVVSTFLPLAFAIKACSSRPLAAPKRRRVAAAPDHCHWLVARESCHGAPLGHRLALSSSFLVCWPYFPRDRAASALLCAELVAALMAAESHFSGDVLDGAVMSMVVRWLVTAAFPSRENALQTSSDQRLH